MDRTGWQAYLDTTHKQQRGIVIASRDENLLLDYLEENFGTDSIPFPRDYVNLEITEFFTDSDARVFLQTTYNSCHDLDVIFNSRFTPDRWRTIVIADRERGAELEDEEVERLVEWLSRVRGTNPTD